MLSFRSATMLMRRLNTGFRRSFSRADRSRTTNRSGPPTNTGLRWRLQAYVTSNIDCSYKIVVNPAFSTANLYVFPTINNFKRCLYNIWLTIVKVRYKLLIIRTTEETLGRLEV